MGRERVDLVHLNSAVPFCKYVGIAARTLGLKVVWHIREDPRGKRARRLRKWIRLLAHRVIVVSSELEDAFEAFPVVKIFNGVDVGRFHPGIDRTPFRDRFGIPPEAFLFGVVGTIEERKGTLLFLHAAEALLKAGRDAFFSIVGDGAVEDERAVRHYLAGRPTLASRVVLTGRLEDMPQVMAGIDVLVMPSLWEGFPRSLIEAMASGRAAIASGVGEIPFILEDGVCGRVVPKGDRAALSRAMEELLHRRGDLAEMGRRGRRRVLEEFTLEKHVRTVMGEYQKLLGQNGPGLGADDVKGVRK
jgi:glycosyltransferase involved in cell wall biosynthesis